MARGSSAAASSSPSKKVRKVGNNNNKAKRFESVTMQLLGKANRVLTDDAVNYITRRARIGHLSDQATRRLGAAFLALNHDMIERANIFTRARTGKDVNYQIKLIDTKNALAHMGIAGPLVLRRGRRAHSDQYCAPQDRPDKIKKKKKDKKSKKDDIAEDEPEGEQEGEQEEEAAAAAPSPKKKASKKTSTSKKKK
jgi:hypothetical protein